MINGTGQKLLIITEQDGEILFKVEKDEIINIRSKLQAKNDKFYSPKIKINKGRFIKVMFKEEEVVKKFIKSPSTYLALNIMKKYLVTNYNVLTKNGKKYKCVDLAKDMGITRQSASIHIKRLEKENLIAEVSTNKGILFAINPEYYLVGDEVPQIILDAFNKNK